MVRSDRLLRLYPSVGGERGGYFEDSPEIVSAGPISKIEIRSGEFIDAIRVTYGSGSGARAGAWHGGGGGFLRSWDVPQGYKLYRVTGRHGNYVDQIQFEAINHNYLSSYSPGFGGAGGNRFEITGDHFGGTEWNVLEEIMGCCGELVDRLYFRFKNEQRVYSIGTSSRGVGRG